MNVKYKPDFKGLGGRDGKNLLINILVFIKC